MAQKELNESKENVKEITIDAVARVSQERDGHWSRGIKTKDGWLNVVGMEQKDVDALFIPEKFARGNTVRIESDGRSIIFLELVSKSQKKDDDIVNLETLLSDAHKLGLVGIHTSLISHDTENKSAVFKAVVRMRDLKKEELFKIYEGHGDADQKNVGDTIKPHYIRMAETRAICRALRWATNNANLPEEEK